MRFAVARKEAAMFFQVVRCSAGMTQTAQVVEGPGLKLVGNRLELVAQPLLDIWWFRRFRLRWWRRQGGRPP